MMDHSNHTRLLPSELATVDGATIYGPGDEKGHVSHLHSAGQAATVVVDVGGFLGIGAKPVALPIQDAGRGWRCARRYPLHQGSVETTARAY